MAGLTLCLVRDECWRDIASKDGTGAVVRDVESSAKRPNLCGYEAAGTIHLCAKKTIDTHLNLCYNRSIGVD